MTSLHGCVVFSVGMKYRLYWQLLLLVVVCGWNNGRGNVVVYISELRHNGWRIFLACPMMMGGSCGGSCVNIGRALK